MLDLFGNFRSKAKVATLATVFLMSFSLYGLYCINTVTDVKINGALYGEIIKGKDVVADILPPPAYLIETCLTAYQLLDEGDSARILALSERAAVLKAEYLARIDHWKRNLPAGDLKTALVVESSVPAMRMLEAFESRFLPALRSGDKSAARTAMHGSILPEYELHRARIDAVVALAEKRNRQLEARAAVAVHSRTYGQIVIGLLLFAFLSVFSAYVIGQEEKDRALKAASGSGETGSHADSEAPARTRG